jgi:hypothetical protein
VVDPARQAFGDHWRERRNVIDADGGKDDIRHGDCLNNGVRFSNGERLAIRHAHPARFATRKTDEIASVPVDERNVATASRKKRPKAGLVKQFAEQPARHLSSTEDHGPLWASANICSHFRTPLAPSARLFTSEGSNADLQLTCYSIRRASIGFSAAARRAG